MLRTSQLASHGFSARDVQVRVRQASWLRISSRVIFVHGGAPSRLAMLTAAALHHERVGLTGVSALELEGLPAPRDGRVELLGPRGTRQLPFEGCNITTTPDPQFVTDARPLRTDVAESVIRAVGLATSARQAVFYITWAIQRRLTTLQSLHKALETQPASPRTAFARRIVDLVDPDVHSIHEFDFLTACRLRGLPEPDRQVQRTDSDGHLRYTDFEFQVGSRALVVEIDGLGHLDTGVRVDDQWRANEISLQSATVLRVPAQELLSDTDRWMDQIQRGIDQLRAP